MKPLDDLYITPHSIGILQDFVRSQGDSLPGVQGKLEQLAKRHGIPFTLWWELLEELNNLLNIAALGSAIGLSTSPKQTGILGYLTQTSATLLDALRCFERFQRLVYEGGRARISLKGRLCTLSWEDDFMHSTQMSDEVIVGSLLSIMRHSLQDPELTFDAITFTGKPMGAASVYFQLYGCYPQFQQSHLSLSFDSKYLIRPISSSDAQLHTILIEQAENKLPLQGSEPGPSPSSASNPELSNQTFKLRLQKAIMRALHEGKPSAAHIAGKLNISSRTLHRRLGQQGFIFRDFLRGVRKQLAAEYLLEDRLSFTEIALLLGYSEQSAFSRAFLEWYQQTPSEFKQQRIEKN